MHISCQVPILLLISFDGFRHDYLSPELTPNLHELSQRATLGRMESLFFTKTFPNHLSMVTGLFEDEHQVINNYMFDPHLNRTFDPSNEDPAWWNPKGKTVPIWTANELLDCDRADRYSGSMMYPGSGSLYLSSTPTYVKSFDKARNWTKNIETVIDWLTDPIRPANFVSIYFDEPDSSGHQFGPWHEKTLRALKSVDQAIGHLMKRLAEVNLDEQANLIFVSDHGMDEVREVIFLEDFVDVNQFTMVGASPIWSVFVRPEFKHLKARIFQRLKDNERIGNYSVSTRETIPKSYHYSNTDRIGDFLIVANHHCELIRSRADVKYDYPDVFGNHGWAPTDDSMRPLFMALGNKFKQSYYHPEPFPNIDLYPLMLRILDLPDVPSNGSLSRVLDLLDPSGNKWTSC